MTNSKSTIKMAIIGAFLCGALLFAGAAGAIDVPCGGVDDTAIIQSALYSGVSPVVISGDCRTGNVFVPGNVLVYGTATIKPTANFDGSMFWEVIGDNVEISEIFFDVDPAEWPHAIAVHSTGVSIMYWHDLHVRGGGGHGLQCENGIDCAIEHNVVRECGMFGIEMHAIQNGRIVNNETGDTGHEGINVMDSQNILISGNTPGWGYPSVSQDFGISIYGSPGNFCSGVTVENNVTVRSGKAGIGLVGNVIDPKVINNTLLYSGQIEAAYMGVGSILLVGPVENAALGGNKMIRQDRRYPGIVIMDAGGKPSHTKIGKGNVAY